MKKLFSAVLMSLGLLLLGPAMLKQQENIPWV